LAQEQLQRETRPSRNRACFLVALENGPAPSAQERFTARIHQGRRGSPDEPGASPGEVGQETGKGCHRSLLPKNVDSVIKPAKSWRMEMPPENEEANGQTVS